MKVRRAPKPGEVFEFDGVELIAVEGLSCKRCFASEENDVQCSDLPLCGVHNVEFIRLDKYLVMRLKGEV